MADLTNEEILGLYYEVMRTEKSSPGANSATIKLYALACQLYDEKRDLEDKDVDKVIDAFYDWYGYSLSETIEIARKKCGYARGDVDHSINSIYYEHIKKSWELIKNRCGELFDSERFSTENYDKSYSKNAQKDVSIIDCIDKIVYAKDDKSRSIAFQGFNTRIFAAYYGKEELPDNTQSKKR